MASKAVAFLALCCLLLAAKQVAAGRGRILEEPDYDAWLNDNLADAKINKTTRKLIEDNNDQALYNDIINNPSKYATQQNDTPPKFDIILKEDVLYNEILKNPAKFNAILNDTALNNDPAKIIALNETAMFNEILHDPIKYTEITNGSAQNNNLMYGTILNGTAPNNLNNTGKYNTPMGFWHNVYEAWMNTIESNKDTANNNNAQYYNTVLNDAANNNSTAKYNTVMGFWDRLVKWVNEPSNDAADNDSTQYNIVLSDAANNNSTPKYNTILSAQNAQP